MIQANILSEPVETFAGQRTARKAVEILLAHDSNYCCPSSKQRRALLVGFAMIGKTLYGAAFDVVRLDTDIDLEDPEAIAANTDAITICEV